MIGSTTFTICDTPQGTKVDYLMVRKAAIDMNRVPNADSIPDISVPVTREIVAPMIAADCGRNFQPNEILIKPSGAASALSGGAFVDVLPSGLDPNNGLNYKISMVFDSTGKMVTYQRDPFF
jgi:hypothetical protein